MNILWKKGQGTVGDVVAALPRRPPIAYNTVQTLLRILEEKGYVSHEQVGKTICLSPRGRAAGGPSPRARPPR